MVWETTRTVRWRLNIPDNRKSDLHATNTKFQYCANRTAAWAWRYPDEDCVTSKSKAEAAIYDELRHETDSLHANLVQKVTKRATDDIGNCIDRLADDENTSKLEYDTFRIICDKRAGLCFEMRSNIPNSTTPIKDEFTSEAEARDGRTHSNGAVKTEYGLDNTARDSSDIALDIRPDTSMLSHRHRCNGRQSG